MNPKSTILKIKDLASLVGTKDTRTILRWLVKMGVHYTKIGREYVIDEWSLNFRMELSHAESLKQQFPLKWSDIFRLRCQDESILKAVFTIHPPNTLKTQIKRNNNNSNHFK